ncbi:MAG: carboxylesterase family protein [Bryobacteraceae bacterium]|jgi:para-nitrobenzyl esterase
MKRLPVALCFAALLASPLLAAIQEPIKVEGGLVSGTPGWAWGVRAYLGIPFASPPVGNRRWRPPQPVVPWQGVRAAREFSAACMQSEDGWTDEQLADPGLWHKSEDCLYLNVWTPATSANERLPVLLWIHAGAGTMGSTARPIYDGNALAKKGVVVVSANYRLGVFGWFAHPELTRESEHRSSGNYGALDQLAALQWVQKNIAQFGGDPSKVTMFGQSAGCGAVYSLAASPLAKGLARGGIGQSFRTFHRMITLAEAESAGAQFAKAIGKPTLAALRAMPAQDLLEASRKTPAATAANAAIVDGWFLPQDIYTIYSQGKQNDIALITGGTNDEGAVGGLGTEAATPPNTLAAYTAWVKQIFGARADAILRAYPAKTDAEAARAYHDVYRDINFAVHRTWAKLQATTGKSPAYLYKFSHIPPHPEPNGINAVAPVGAVHSSDVRYVFNTLRMKDYAWTDIDRKVADMLGSYWTNFAKNSNPNGPGLSSWSVYNPKDEYLMNLGDTFRLERFNSAGVDLVAAAEDDLRRAGSGHGTR